MQPCSENHKQVLRFQRVKVWMATSCWVDVMPSTPVQKTKHIVCLVCMVFIIFIFLFFLPLLMIMLVWVYRLCYGKIWKIILPFCLSFAIDIPHWLWSPSAQLLYHSCEQWQLFSSFNNIRKHCLTNTNVDGLQTPPSALPAPQWLFLSLTDKLYLIAAPYSQWWVNWRSQTIFVL